MAAERRRCGGGVRSARSTVTSRARSLQASASEAQAARLPPVIARVIANQQILDTSLLCAIARLATVLAPFRLSAVGDTHASSIDAYARPPLLRHRELTLRGVAGHPARLVSPVQAPLHFAPQYHALRGQWLARYIAEALPGLDGAIKQ